MLHSMLYRAETPPLLALPGLHLDLAVLGRLRRDQFEQSAVAAATACDGAASAAAVLTSAPCSPGKHATSASLKGVRLA